MNKRKIIVYISGKYSGEIDDNIHKARQISIRLWELGYTVITPHLNTIHYEKDCKCAYENFIEGDLEILKRVDVVFMLDNWAQSRGATIEHDEAVIQGIPIFYNIETLESWFHLKPTVTS